MSGAIRYLTPTITYVGMEPNRFGLIQPVLNLETPQHHYAEPFRVILPDVQDLIQKDYRQYQKINLKVINDVHYIPGDIIDRSEEHHDPNCSAYTTLMTHRECPICWSQVSFYNDSFYCENPQCDSIIQNQLTHMCSKRVLDLPLGEDDLLYLYQGFEYVPTSTPVSWLLTRNAKHLAYIRADVEAIEATLEVLEDRREMLNGICAHPDVQNVVQGRFLDSLSLPGLYQSHIQKLRYHLKQNHWEWSQLLETLTNIPRLVSFGIPYEDACCIARGATIRQQDIIAITRL